MVSEPQQTGPDETRGGERPDWENVRPGEELPQLAADQCGGACGNPGCEPA